VSHNYLHWAKYQNTLTCQIIVLQILLFFGEKTPTQPY
jgi:hypothetical protein